MNKDLKPGDRVHRPRLENHPNGIDRPEEQEFPRDGWVITEIFDNDHLEPFGTWAIAECIVGQFINGELIPRTYSIKTNVQDFRKVPDCRFKRGDRVRYIENRRSLTVVHVTQRHDDEKPIVVAADLHYFEDTGTAFLAYEDLFELA